MGTSIRYKKNNLPVKGFLDLKDIQIPQGQDLIDAILKLKKEKCRDFGALLSARRNSRYCRLFGRFFFN